MDQSTAQRILHDATLPSGRRCTSREEELGHWLLPDDATGIEINKRISKYLFDWSPQWAIICTYDPSHVHIDPDGIRTVGCWWIFECNPFKVPRTWYPVFPLLVATKIVDGIKVQVIDRKFGKIVHPNHIPLDLISTTLAHKDVYNPATYRNLKDAIKMLDAHNAEIKLRTEADIAKFDEDFVKEMVSDITPRAGIPKRAVPILDEFGNEIKK